MQDILRRFSQLDVDSDVPTLETEPSSLGFLGELTPEEVERMTAEELLAHIGPEALRRFEEDLRSNPKFIEEALKKWRPWWLSPPVVVAEEERGKGKSKGDVKDDDNYNYNDNANDNASDGPAFNQTPSTLERVPEPLEELPPLSELSAERPPEALWNNLVELLYLYAYLTRMYSDERMTLSADFVRDFCLFSRVLSSQRFTHSSVIHALRSVEAAISLESEAFIAEETKIIILDDLQALLKRGDFILAALGDLQRIFEKSVKHVRSNFHAAKKIYFYNVWISDEIAHDGDLVETITVSIRSLISGYGDSLTRSPHSELKNHLLSLKIPRKTTC